MRCPDFEASGNSNHDVIHYLQTLDEIATILPNLKLICLNNINLGQTPSSKLVNFTRAEYIRVCYYGSSDDVSGLAYCRSSSLQRLDVFGAYLPSDALISLPQIATQLKSVSFSHCSVQRSSDILLFVQQSKSLTTLELVQLSIKTVCETADTTYGHSGVRHLQFSDKSKELLHALAELCPELETIVVQHELVEDDLSKIGQFLKRLKSLTLTGCKPHGQAMEVECLRHISSGFDELKKLQIKAWGVPKEKVLEVLQGLREDVVVSYSSC